MADATDFPIDAVITWVDGNDAKHREKMSYFLENKTTLNSKTLRMRFDQVDEIEYTVNSILKYAPFIRHIYIVTDNQTPNFLKDKTNAKTAYNTVFIVDHKTIFRDYLEVLPTFNCRPIETQLYKIPNLAEHFIYFNDDLSLLRPVKITDFFNDKKPVLRGKWTRFNEDVFFKKIKYFFQNKTQKNKATHKKAQEKGAKLAGFKKYFKFHHTPHPFRKSTFVNYFSEHKSVELENVKYRFRHVNQFTPQSLINHIEIKNKTAVLVNDYKMAYFQNYKKPFWWLKLKLKHAENNSNILFLCMQSLDQCAPEKLHYIKAWFKKRLF